MLLGKLLEVLLRSSWGSSQLLGKLAVERRRDRHFACLYDIVPPLNDVVNDMSHVYNDIVTPWNDIVLDIGKRTSGPGNHVVRRLLRHGHVDVDVVWHGNDVVIDMSMSITASSGV